jgi:hypothetical protein
VEARLRTKHLTRRLAGGLWAAASVPRACARVASRPRKCRHLGAICNLRTSKDSGKARPGNASWTAWDESGVPTTWPDAVCVHVSPGAADSDLRIVINDAKTTAPMRRCGQS